MRVVNLKGREVPWKIAGCRVLGTETRPRSGLHLEARRYLLRAMPGEALFEEVPVPGTLLRLDFVVPARRVAVEVQGRQHFEYCPHFHKTRAAFRDALRRDADKARFCDLNNLTLVALRHDRVDDWERLLREA